MLYILKALLSDLIVVEEDEPNKHFKLFKFLIRRQIILPPLPTSQVINAPLRSLASS